MLKYNFQCLLVKNRVTISENLRKQFKKLFYSENKSYTLLQTIFLIIYENVPNILHRIVRSSLLFC